MLSLFSSPEYVKNKARIMGLNPVYESSRKNKNTQFLMVINGFILDNSGIKITQSIKMRKDDFCLEREIRNGSLLLFILLRGYRGIYFDEIYKIAPQNLSPNPFSIFF